jgi:hypothetical protein
MGHEAKSKNGESWEEKFSEAGSQIEEELRRVIGYINDEVVPQVRRNGSIALRAAAAQMQELAQRMDDDARRQKGTSNSQGGAK